MKKNVMLKIAAVLLVAVLLSTCAISATFAKYVTNGGEYSETATVAKWGVKITTIADDTDLELFKDEYTDGATENPASVKLATGKKAIAPGTKGSLTMENMIEGEPEVSGKVVYYVRAVADGFGSYTCPVVVTVNDTTIPVTEDANADYTEAKTYYFQPGDDLADVDEMSIEWKWAFEGDSVNDTNIGNLDTAPTLKIEVKIAVEQTGPAVAGAI